MCRCVSQYPSYNFCCSHFSFFISFLICFSGRGQASSQEGSQGRGQRDPHEGAGETTERGTSQDAFLHLKLWRQDALFWPLKKSLLVVWPCDTCWVESFIQGSHRVYDFFGTLIKPKLKTSEGHHIFNFVTPSAIVCHMACLCMTLHQEDFRGLVGPLLALWTWSISCQHCFTVLSWDS